MPFLLTVPPGLCLKCRGAKALCGRVYCPLLLRRTTALRLESMGDRELGGTTPPAVFVGRYGYPNVRIAALVPPESGDTSVYDFPEMWVNYSIDRILSMRLSLVRAYKTVSAKKPSNKVVEEMRELAMSSRPVDLEAELLRKPSGVKFDDHTPPMGPASPFRRIKVSGNPKVDRPVEKAYGDTDLPATLAAVFLYRSGVPVSRIARILSVGAIGRGKSRRLVPTRWSITAVDDMISKYLVGRVRDLEELGEILVYTRRTQRNFFAAILIPGKWGYEWIEAWYPRTAWNPTDKLEVEGDWEGYWGRKTYASLGGCYYAVRLAAAEHLYYRLKRQAKVVVLREIYEGFFAPIGVWFVRENTRRMFGTKPARFSTVEDAVKYVSSMTRLGAKDWIASSKILRDALMQRSILEWVVAGGEIPQGKS